VKTPVPGGPPEGDRITRSTRDLHETAERLQRWLRGQLPRGSAPTILAASIPESNGMSSETLLFTARWVERGTPVQRQLVARIEPPADAHPVFTRYDLGLQHRVMRLVRDQTAVPVPDPLWYEPDPATLGGAFFVMERVDGLVPPDVLPYTFGDNWVFDASDAARSTLEDSAVRALAGIHSVTPDRHDLAYLEHPAEGSTSLERSLNHWSSYHDAMVAEEPSPLLAACFSWLRDNLPIDCGRDALSWGDARIGNMMFRDFEVVAVLDWEMAEVAPPEVDLGWLCHLHRFFHDLAVELKAPGLPAMLRPADVRAEYGRWSGREPGDLTWHMFYAAVRHGLNMRRVAERAIWFGEAPRPAHVDDLIMHRSTLEAMLDGSYWSSVAL